MTDIKFTKGEWVDNGDMETAIITTIDRSFSHVVDICEVQTGFGGDIGIEQKANAHLIAAAPPMYELLDNIRILCEWGHDKQTLIDLILTESLPEIKELLKKARGE